MSTATITTPINRGGIRYWVDKPTEMRPVTKPQLMRDVLGEVLRAERHQRRMNLRELSEKAFMSLGYISEIERGRKEASSESIVRLCEGLGLSQSALLYRVAGELTLREEAQAAASAFDQARA